MYSIFYAAFHPVSRGLVTKIPLNNEKVCVDKYSVQMLGDPPLVSLVQDRTVSNM
jgi:hypothetical protein